MPKVHFKYFDENGDSIGPKYEVVKSNKVFEIGDIVRMDEGPPGCEDATMWKVDNCTPVIFRRIGAKQQSGGWYDVIEDSFQDVFLTKVLISKWGILVSSCSSSGKQKDS